MDRRMSRVVLILAVLLLTLGLAACGGEESSSGGGATTEDTTTEGTTSAETETETETEAGTSGGGDGPGELKGETGPGFEISVKFDGEDAETVPAGTYTLSVEDKSSMHNFRLMGPGGVNVEVTDVGFVGEKSAEVTLEPGTYTYQCDPHASQMTGTFTVT
jgi:plastocyanin